MQPIELIFMSLLLAHLLGDCSLQFDWIARNKGKRLSALACHCAIHWVLAWGCLLVFGGVPFFCWRSQTLLAGYAVAHLLIDRLKYRLSSKTAWGLGSVVPAVDQALHIATIAAVTLMLAGNPMAGLSQLFSALASARIYVLEIATVYFGVVVAGGYLIRYLTKGFRSSMSAHAGSAPAADEPELKNAGLYIGYLERILILTAILARSATLVGLILTGKSIARFPELKKPRFAEYFLIGTLLSILLAVLGGLLLQAMLYGSIDFK